MRAARERMRGLTGALSVSTKKGNESGHRGIRVTSEAEVAKLYKLGDNVMESTNTGMDVLYATRQSDGVEVVVKRRMRHNSFKSSQEEREWRVTTEYQLNMPRTESICAFHEILETKEAYYVVMEKVGGQDLFEQMATGRLSHAESRDVIKQIIHGLEIMHSSGRIHKDLKIENIMVDTSYPERQMDPTSPVLAKLIDFDTVQDWEPCSPKAKDVLGTDGYIAPEAYGGEYSPASDIYAVGVIMYKMLTGRFPSRPDIFDDQPGENYVGSSAMLRIQKRLQKEAIDFSIKPFDRCPEALQLCTAMLAYDAEARPSAADAMKSDWFLLDAKALGD
eukprot:TRINITY_DN34356_c0_g1_i1.p1 TRINITY_DN34356_c0_g1~~TRINITY_DN34356_c0_g1_i1.p1  ORF type:complete len:334 (-),score=74.72 TRINITY_DN34356_c0_g1_i1:391-1392(-)